MGEGQRARETQKSKPAPGSELSAYSPMWGSNLTPNVLFYVVSLNLVFKLLIVIDFRFTEKL